METNSIERDFSRLRVLPTRQQSVPPTLPNTNQNFPSATPSSQTPPTSMEETAWATQELQSALESTTKPEGDKLVSNTPARKRRSWRRRCKSTSNLSNLSNTVNSGNDSTSDEEEEQLFKTIQSDSEDMQEEDQTMKQMLPKKKPVGVALARHHLPIESDSVNENLSPLRPNTKRKRKFKRMALDPEPATPIDGGGEQTSKKKHKTRTRYEVHVKHPLQICSSASTSSTGIVVGKRKRSTREKSVEPEHMATLSPVKQSVKMDCDMTETLHEDDGRRSSSSISSSEWDDNDTDNPDSVDNGREADDEQSDWPGAEPVYLPGSNSQMTDDETDIDLDAFLSGDPMGVPMTATARQAYLARMKRLAECVPGREIRAGSRKVRNRQSGFTIKSSSSEQLSRFLQDPSRTELKLTVIRNSDRSKVVHLANLYSLSVRLEEGSNLLVLSKTGRTVRVNSEFAVPGKGVAKTPIEFKRRRRTPPNSPLLEGSSTSNEPNELMISFEKMDALSDVNSPKSVVSTRAGTPDLLEKTCTKVKFSGSLSS